MSIRRLRGLIAGLIVVATTAVLFAPVASAHKPSDSYLRLDVRGASVDGRWDIALRDLERVVGLDANGDAVITWGELTNRADAVSDHALAQLALSTPAGRCTLQAGDIQVVDHTDGTYAVLPLSGQCPDAIDRLTVDYALLFDSDAQHRGLLRLTRFARTQSAIFTTGRRETTLDLGESGRLRVAGQYFAEGLWHVLIGLDHLLFLAGLLLPVVVHRERGRYVVADSAGRCALDVLRIVTSFTAAHFVALTLASLGWIDLPGRWVESAVALTIVLAALNNLTGWVTRRLWVVAFGFGLIHGAGYASVLSDLGLPPGTLALALLAFNLGVEGAQIAVAAVFLPVAFVLRRHWVYQRLILVPGSLLVAAMGLVWLVERATGFQWPG